MKRRFFSTLILATLALLILFPFVYALLGSFFSPSEFASSPATLWPSAFSLKNYTKILQTPYFFRFLVNSLLSATLSTLLRLVVAILASFAFFAYNFKGKRTLLLFLTLTFFIPSDLLLGENFVTISRLKLLNTTSGIILPGLLSVSMMLVLRAFFTSLPSSLFDAAKMDGAKDGYFLLHVLLPLNKAILSSLALQSFITVFNSYLWPLLVTNKTSMRTIQVAITMLSDASTLNYGPTFSAIVLLSLPFILLFIFARKALMKALSAAYLYA